MWDENLRMYGPNPMKECGENRYIGVKNIFEFYIKPDCNITIMPRDAIQCNVRMEWTMKDFFAAGGTTKFVDRLAASLGIHFSSIKIVSVYEGSVVIDYDIVEEPINNQPLNTIKEKQIELFATNKIDLGGPILDSTI